MMLSKKGCEKFVLGVTLAVEDVLPRFSVLPTLGGYGSDLLTQLPCARLPPQ